MTKLFRMISVGMLTGLMAGYAADCGDNSSTSCASGNCLPACSDGVLTAPESDVDCGGDICPACAVGKKCLAGTDCATGVCASGVCAMASCTDGVRDGNESDVDCGGSCQPCAQDKACKSAGDCASGICTGGRCGTPSCSDGIKNGSESDVDCGGSCGPCGLGKSCAVDNDCAPWSCDNGKCGLGTGNDGPLTVAATMTQTINTVSAGATGAQGSTALTLSSATGFAAGQAVFIHQTQGGAAGSQEVNHIAAVNGTAVTLTKPLANQYTTGAQAVVMPQYSTVSVAAGGTLNAPAWNGTSGGILAFQATGAVSVDGTVAMTGRGFRGGGDAVKCFPGSPACLVNNGRYGESEVGVSSFTTQNASGYGSNNGSGGGGGTHGQDCAAGGGGSHGTAGTAGTDGSQGVCTVGAKHGGGVSGTLLGSPDLTQKIFFGGAGGEGGPDEDGTHPGPGGNGGGLVVLFASSLTINNASGVIDVSGNGGSVGANNFPGCGGSGGGMGNGGGGAGGAVRIITAGSAAVGNGRITSLGGSAGSGGSCGTGSPGGQGGMGRIQVRAGGQTTGTTNPVAFN